MLLRHSFFHHIGNRLARAAVQHEDLAPLGQLHQRGDGATLAVRDVIQGRLRGHVVIPDIVVDGLIRPAFAARGHVEGDDGRRVFFRQRRTLAAPEVGLLIARRQVHQAQCIIKSGRRPHVRRAARVGLSFRRQLGDGRIAQVPGPHQFPRIGAVGAHDARGFIGGAAVKDPAAEDDQVARDGRRGRVGVVRHVHFHLAQADGEVDGALVAETLAPLARLRVDLDQARIHGHLHDAFGARARHRRAGRLHAVKTERLRHLRRLVVADAATAVPCLDVGRLRIEAPALLARVRVERDDLAGRRARIDGVADLQRRVLRFRRALGQLARAVSPRHLQLVDVGLVDLRVRREARAFRPICIVRPVGAAVVDGRHGILPRLRGGLEHAVRLEHGSEAGCQHDGKQGGETARLARVFASRQPRMQQGGGQADNEERRQARHHGPESEADFPHGPQQGDQRQRANDAARQRLAAPIQHAGQDQAKPGQQVIPGTAKGDQFDAARRQGQAGKSKKHAKNRQGKPLAPGDRRDRRRSILC